MAVPAPERAGLRRAVLFGGILLVLGHLGMAFEGHAAYRVNGEVVRDTSAFERRWTLFGTLLHYYTYAPIRRHADFWRQLVLWTSGLAMVSAGTGAWASRCSSARSSVPRLSAWAAKLAGRATVCAGAARSAA